MLLTVNTDRFARSSSKYDCEGDLASTSGPKIKMPDFDSNEAEDWNNTTYSINLVLVQITLIDNINIYDPDNKLKDHCWTLKLHEFVICYGNARKRNINEFLNYGKIQLNELI